MGLKWPTLQQLYQALFGISLDSSHNAIADVRACAKCFFELERLGVLSGQESDEDDEDLVAEDEELFDEVYALADLCDWFDTGLFVDDVYEHFQERGSITEAQRDALIRIRDMLEEKAG